MDQVVSKVEKQELEIQYIKKTLDELVEQNKKQNEQLSKISESIQKQEMILEKMNMLEEKYSDGIKRVHLRIDEEFDRYKENSKQNKIEIDEIKKQLNKPCPEHNVIETELKYMQEKIEKHAKIFWWVTSAIGIAVITALMRTILK